MSRPPPRLRQHVRGYWFCRWGGRDHHFGRDHAVAERAYHSDPQHGLPGWIRWQERKAEVRRLGPMFASMTVLDLAERFLHSRLTEGGPGREDYYRKHLKRFATAYGADLAAQIRPRDLQALKDGMLARRYAPGTVNHDIGAVRTMFRWATGLEFIPPVSLHGVRKLPLGEVPDRSMTKAAVLDYVLGPIPKGKRKRIFPGSPNLQAWLAVSYLAGLRPTEAVHLVNDWGEWAETGVFRVRNKARQNVRLARHIILSPEALSWYEQCDARWTRLDSYSQAVCDALGQGPHRLRHSAATHLLAAKVPRADVDIFLGHYPPRVSLVYMQPQWKHLRRLAARITLRT